MTGKERNALIRSDGRGNADLRDVKLLVGVWLLLPFRLLMARRMG